MTNMNENMEKGVDNLGFELTPDDSEQVKVNFGEIYFEDLPKKLNVIESFFEKIHSYFDSSKFDNSKINIVFKVIVMILCKVYFICAVLHFIQKKNLNDDLNLDFCNGFGFLLLLTIVIDLSLFYYKIIKPYFTKWIKTTEGEKFIDRIKNGKIVQIYEKFMSKWWSSIAISATVFLCIFVFLLVDTASDRRRLISFFGLIVLIICGFLCSNNPARIRYIVYWYT